MIFYRISSSFDSPHPHKHISNPLSHEINIPLSHASTYKTRSRKTDAEREVRYKRMHQIIDKKQTQTGRIIDENIHKRAVGENELRRIITNPHDNLTIGHATHRRCKENEQYAQ